MKKKDDLTIGKFSRKAKLWRHQRENDKSRVVFIDGKKKVL